MKIFEKIKDICIRIFGKKVIGIDFSSGKERSIKTTGKVLRGKTIITKIEEIK